MVAVTHTIRLSGENHFGSKAPPAAPSVILRNLPDALRQSVLMSVEGRTSPRGRPPRWLELSSDIRFVGLSGDDDTILHFEAPTLGEAAEDLYQQQELWNTRPNPGDSCFDLFGDVINDVRSCKEDSQRFDSRLLKKFKRLGAALDCDYDSISIGGNRTNENEAIITNEVVANAARMVQGTPSPNRVRVVGMLDMIRASTEAFAIKLDDGQEVAGVVSGGEVKGLPDLFQQRVLVLGMAVYRPSGSLLRIDAEQVSAANGEPSLWSRMPAPTKRKTDRTNIVQFQGPKSGLAAIIGKWPGDESDEDIDAALRQIS
ncbi:MAG: hypothetical protein AAFN77_23595 [Planctomycetota bacterium]